MTEPGGKNIVEIFQAHTESRLNDVHTQIPGRFLSYDEKTGLAKVEPLVKLKRNVNGKELTLTIPPIDNVPVMMLSTQSFILEFPIKKNDGCAIFFSEVGIGNFINSCNQVVEADDFSRFSLTDAFAIPGLWCKKGKPSGTPTIKLTDTGILQFLGATESFVKGDTLETQMNTFLNALAAIVPGDVSANATALAAIKSAAAAFLTTLSSIKSTKIKGE